MDETVQQLVGLLDFLEVELLTCFPCRIFQQRHRQQSSFDFSVSGSPLALHLEELQATAKASVGLL